MTNAKEWGTNLRLNLEAFERAGKALEKKRKQEAQKEETAKKEARRKPKRTSASPASPAKDPAKEAAEEAAPEASPQPDPVEPTPEVPAQEDPPREGEEKPPEPTETGHMSKQDLQAARENRLRMILKNSTTRGMTHTTKGEEDQEPGTGHSGDRAKADDDDDHGF